MPPIPPNADEAFYPFQTGYIKEFILRNGCVNIKVFFNAGFRPNPGKAGRTRIRAQQISLDTFNFFVKLKY
jgi:hypothetical protein